MSTAWNPEQYEKFKAQRAKPFFDLAHLVQPDAFGLVVDLGCGTGELTRWLFDQWHPKSLIGVDSSEKMLEKAAAHAVPGLSFARADIATFRPTESVGLLFSNAALHWLPDHEALFPRLLGWVRPGGQVAIQMPANFDHPSHRIAKQVALRLFPQTFAVDVSGVLTLERYAEILFRNGFDAPSCRMEIYGHPMASGAEVVEWTRGSLLTAYQEKLSPGDFSRFVDTYRRELLAEIGEGSYFYAFKRILLWGRKQSRRHC